MTILNTPIEINGMTLPDRIVMPPMATSKASEDGSVTEALCRYYGEKAKDECIGLIITEHSYISAEGRAHSGQVSIADDRDIEGLKQLVETIHACNTKVICQISHAGSSAKPADPDITQLSCSAVDLPGGRPILRIPREMTEADIKKVIADFAAAARRAKAAGYDGVEIHAAHGYLLNQFYSPLTNHRTDEYTGSTLEGRIRLHLEVIKAVREAVGTDYPVALRLGACDYMPGGTTIEDSVHAAKQFEAAGIDLLDISGGLCRFANPQSTEEGYFSEITAAIKPELHIPVILTGGIVTPEAAESLLEQNKADLIGVGRAILKDSDWAKNAIQAITAER